MRQSKKRLNQLEIKRIADSRDKPSLLLDITQNSQPDFPHEERDGSLDSICLNKNEETQNSTCFTENSLNESQRNFAYQPEDEDENLEMSLQSQGSSLGDVYPSIINQIGKAWHRQHVSEAADSVRRRYHKWRHLSRSRTSLNTSIHTSTRHSRDKNINRAVFNKENTQSPVKMATSAHTAIKSFSKSPVKMVKDVLGLRTPLHCSPVRTRAPQRRESPHPIHVMDLSTSSQPDHTILNKTFTVSEVTSPHRSRHNEYTSFASSSKSFYTPKKTSQELYYRMKESCMSPRHLQAADSSECTENSFVYMSPVRQSPYKAQLTSSDSYNERDIYGSPVRLRQSPYKSQTLRESLGESSLSFVPSPKSPYVHNYPRELKRQKLVSTSLPSPKIIQRTLQYPAPRPSSQQKMHSPQLATSSRRPHRMRRHLSFDSSLPSSRASFSAKDLDEDFVKLYHKFVCMNKSFLQTSSRHLCAKNSDANRGHSFSNLAALALSPHRSVLRKRHADLDGYPQSKRFKDSYLSCSPGSSRYKHNQMRSVPISWSPLGSHPSASRHGMV